MKNFKKFAGFLSLILVFVAVGMLFVEPGLVYKLGDTSTDVDFSAFNIIFGIENDISEFNMEDVNVLGAIAAGLLVIGALFSLFRGKFMNLIAALALIAAGVLLFVFPSTIDVFMGKFAASWALIVSGILGILAGVINLGKAVA